ncbi:hypothetical protein DEM27_30000 [Metarhizobium album]|uniref:SpoVT-AbrB domain-containing protein n=1 Tax=Metarhizobium album TaxID=2182425 RepID=A0A2U2DH54_9HYPH|nr:hypothetical protein DEM27_30000 [Rhizobium album]
MKCAGDGKSEQYVLFSGSKGPTLISLKITARGQVTLKKEVLRHLGVKPGDTVDVDLLPNGRIQIAAAPLQQKTGLVLKPT